MSRDAASRSSPPHAARAASLVRATLAVADGELRASYVAYVLRSTRPHVLGPVLDAICRSAETADDVAREFVLCLVDATSRADTSEAVQRLREEAAAGAYLALERALRLPTVAPVRASRPPRKEKLPDYGFGRPVTLGERKSLARRPTRDMIERLLEDPHPDVIRRLLVSPRLVEDDVVRIAARRPGRPEVLAELARSTRWIHRSRVRMAVLLNPHTPPGVAAALSALLLRQELWLVVRASQVEPAIRALCHERLARLPPVPGGSPLQ